MTNVVATDVSSGRRRLLAAEVVVSFTMVMPTQPGAEQATFDAVVNDLSDAAIAGGALATGPLASLATVETTAYVEPTLSDMTTADASDSCVGANIIFDSQNECRCEDWYQVSHIRTWQTLYTLCVRVLLSRSQRHPTNAQRNSTTPPRPFANAYQPTTQGVPKWEAEIQSFTDLTCTFVECPIGSVGSVQGTNGRDGDSGCVVVPGYSGKVETVVGQPWFKSTIAAVDCPEGSSGFVPGTGGTEGTSGCMTNTGTHAGAVAASDQPPYFVSSLCAAGSACCAPGKYADPTNGNVCTPCVAGTYQPFATDAANPVSCSVCPAGSFQNSPGSATCAKCPAGQLSRADRTACGACSAGEFGKLGFRVAWPPHPTHVANTKRYLPHHTSVQPIPSCRPALRALRASTPRRRWRTTASTGTCH